MFSLSATERTKERIMWEITLTFSDEDSNRTGIKGVIGRAKFYEIQEEIMRLTNVKDSDDWACGEIQSITIVPVED